MALALETLNIQIVRQTSSRCRRWSPVLLSLLVTVGAMTPAAFVIAEPTPQGTESSAILDEDESLAPATDEAGEAAEAGERESGGSPLARLFLRLMGIAPGDEANEEVEFGDLIGNNAPAFELPSVDGNSVALKDLKGKVVVLDFWASWCGPCRAAMPKLENVQQAMADQPVQVVGVNLGDDRETAEQIAEQLGITFPLVLDSESSLGDLYHVNAIPQTVVIDQKGIVQAVHLGNSANLQSQLTKQIRQLLAGKDLYDSERVAKMRAERAERRVRQDAALKLINEERVVRGDELIEEPEADLFEPDQVAMKVKLPGDTTESFAMITPSLRLVISRPDRAQAKEIALDLPESLEVRSLNAVIVENTTDWLVLGAYYNDLTYTVTQMELQQLDENGRTRWTFDIPPIEGDENLNANAIVADVLGDETPEVLVLEYHDALADHASTEDFAVRLLTVLDTQGKVLVRSKIPGYGACGMEVLRQDGQTYVLMATSEGITRFQVQ
jgi:peroxiredoxin